MFQAMKCISQGLKRTSQGMKCTFQALKHKKDGIANGLLLYVYLNIIASSFLFVRCDFEFRMADGAGCTDMPGVLNTVK